MRTMKTSKNKTKHKHARKGAQRSINEMKLEIMASQV
jgi:hypothetical protein